MTESTFSSLPFPQAAELWLEQHKRYIKHNTERNYRAAIKLLVANLGDVLVKDIQIGHVRAYQAERGKKAGCYLLSQEISVLQQIMKEARCWKPIADLYKPLRVPKRRGGHSISADEERILREIAFSRPKWQLAAHCMLVMLSTTMGFGELRHVRRQDIDLRRRCVVVRDGAKNNYRDRTIPLNAAALDSVLWILARWEKLGGSRDSEFILPHRPRTRKGPWIFTEPMGSIKTAFTAIRKASGLNHFRIYDCRVQAITKLLSNPDVSPQVSKEIAGHISQAMQDHYSIQQHDTKLAALEALEHPAGRPETEPTPPTQQPASAGLIQPALQAEIDRLKAEIARLAERQRDLAVREHPPAPRLPESHARKGPRAKRLSDDPAEVFHRRQSAKNLIAFPSRLA
jgi:integrase